MFHALSNDKLAVLAVVGDGLGESTDLILVGLKCGHTTHGPLIDHLNLLVELGTVRFPILDSRLPFITHLLDHIMGQVTL